MHLYGQLKTLARFILPEDVIENLDIDGITQFFR